ncbi:PilW family protein [Kineococcus sp. LSe6-4]|uniref:PilW family protein n=1 Tax=Kineococcus halophytocola TaxID=3234027 RepID=A0ABV4GXY2_9ACTN
MNRLLARVRRTRRDDAGVTLAELSVTMLIMGILISLVAVVVVQAYKLQGQTIRRENDTTDAQIAMDTMSRALRMATYLQDPSVTSSTGDPVTLPAFSQTTASAITFTSLVGSAADPTSVSAAADPVRITFSLSGGVLSQTTVRPLTAGQALKSTFGTTGSTRVIARGVTSSSSAPLFQFLYKQADGTVSTAVPSGSPALAIRQVRIRLTVDSDSTGQLPGTSLDATVVNQNLAD